MSTTESLPLPKCKDGITLHLGDEVRHVATGEHGTVTHIAYNVYGVSPTVTVATKTREGYGVPIITSADQLTHMEG